MEKLIQFAYSGDQDIMAGIAELDLLFEMYRLADQVMWIFVLYLYRNYIGTDSAFDFCPEKLCTVMFLTKNDG